MIEIMKKAGLQVVFSILIASTAVAAPKVYKDGQGRDVHFPQGEISFADEVVSFSIGNPAPSSQTF